MHGVTLQARTMPDVDGTTFPEASHTRRNPTQESVPHVEGGSPAIAKPPVTGADGVIMEPFEADPCASLPEQVATGAVGPNGRRG